LADRHTRRCLAGQRLHQHRRHQGRKRKRFRRAGQDDGCRRAKRKVGPGMNERGEVTDPRKVEAGYGQKVKGLNDWEGEITGKPAPGSKFTQLKIGMSAAQVLSLLGQPSDQGAHPTGKAWIPFYFGSDRYRYEVVYKGQGRLLFASGAGFGWDANTHLIWIIHSAAEQGFR
jgi:hypothetical protein